MKSKGIFAAILFAFLLGTFGTAAAGTTEINVCFGPTIDVPFGQAHVYWAKILDEQSGGTFKMNVFPSNQLGNDNECIEQALLGDPVVYATDASFYADLGVPDMAIVQAPFLCENWEEMDRLMASDWWQEQEKALEKKGLKILARNWHYGARHTLTKNLVQKPADFAGVKIRVPMSTVYVKAFEAIGAVPTPLSLNETYTALQQGVIDGLENPIATIYGGKYYEVAKFLLMDGHMKSITLPVCGISYFEALSPEHQKLLMKTATEAGEFQNRLSAEKEQEMIDIFIANGVKTTEINFAEFQEVAKKFYSYPEFSNWTPGLYDRIQGILHGAK